MSGRVLVTGGSGFVGRQTLEPLRRLGFDVVAPRHAACDLLVPAATRRLLADVRPSHLLHCAWAVDHGEFWTAGANLDWAAATLVLARAAVFAGVQRIVGVGSCAEYDWADGGARDRREDDATRPTTLYGCTKLAAAQVLAAFCAGAGIGFAWARLFHLYGPGENEARFAPSIMRPLIAGRRATVRHGQLVRDMMPVERAGAALAALVASTMDGAMNVASGEGITLGDFAQRLSDGSPLLTVQCLPAPGQPARMVADITRLRALLTPPG